MYNIPEGPFIVNGIKSWIHCVKCNGQKSNSQIPDKYHYHDYIELLYAFDTDAVVWSGGEKNYFRTGDLIIINSEEPHTFTYNRESHYVCIKFLPHILYADENSLFEFRFVVPFLLENSRQKIFRSNELQNIDVKGLISEIMTEWDSKEAAFELVIRANILKLFTGIFRYWHQCNILPETAQITDTLKTALQYVDENFITATEAEVAAICNMSYNHFSFLFKKAMGKSFVEYITFLRLREAEKLLLSSDKSITDIAWRSGFSTSSYFISKFKKYKGMTPRQFREKTRNMVL
ncbi:MAG: helix-turn-helix domain-containing protein [Clostridia bacterium]|nr:helix-turn-helix domain-containing protein [Clostridia bacterium]